MSIQVKSYTYKRNGKTIVVKGYTRKGNSAQSKSPRSRKGAGGELKDRVLPKIRYNSLYAMEDYPSTNAPQSRHGQNSKADWEGYVARLQKAISMENLHGGSKERITKLKGKLRSAEKKVRTWK